MAHFSHFPSKTWLDSVINGSGPVETWPLTIHTEAAWRFTAMERPEFLSQVHDPLQSIERIGFSTR